MVHINKALFGAVILASGVALSACAPASTGGEDGPILVGMFATTTAATPTAFVNTFSVDGVQAAIDAINADGGIGGRELELAVCDNGGDPNRGATCAREAVQDGWVAVVGGFDPYSANLTLPILEAASIPYVGMLQSAPTEYQSPVSFPVSIGTVGGSVGTFAQMVDDGCTAPLLIVANDPGSDIISGLAGKIFDSSGVNFAGTIVFTTGTPDVNPTVADVLDAHPDCLTMIGNGGDAAKIFGTVRESAGDSIALYAPPGVLLPQVLAALGSAADGIKGASSSPLASSDDPAIQQFLADLFAYKSDAIPNEFALNGYAAVQLLRLGLEDLDVVSGSSLLEHLNSLDNAQVLNYPVLDFTSTRDSELYPRAFNTSVWYSTVAEGNWIPVDDGGAYSDVASFLP